MTRIDTALPEYALVDEIRCALPSADAKRLARAAREATGETVSIEQLDRLSEREWEGYLRELDADRAFLSGLSGAYTLAEIAESEDFDNGVRSFLEDVDTELAAGMLDEAADVIGEIVKCASARTRGELRAALGEPEPDTAPAPALRLFFVYQILPAAKRARTRKVFRYVATADSPENAIEVVRADRPVQLHKCEWRAEEIQGYAAIDWTTEKVK